MLFVVVNNRNRIQNVSEFDFQVILLRKKKEILLKNTKTGYDVYEKMLILSKRISIGKQLNIKSIF